MDKLEKVPVVKETNASDLESSSVDENNEEWHIFKDPVVAAHYAELYERTKYECRFHVDPDFTWTKEEERRVLWKNEYYVTFWAFIMFTALNFDRNNMQQALSDNFLADLGLNTNQLNIGNTINLVCFLVAELPSQLISKKIGADVWIPTQMVLWSAVSMCQAGIKNAPGFYITRGLLGALQGGFICDVGLWISYFYTNSEFPLRLSLFYISNQLSTIFSSLLAFAILKIKTGAITQSWRWLFLLEGLFTLLVGIFAYFKMPASAVQTKAWYRPKGWYTEREEKIVVNRVVRDDPTKGDMNNRQPVGPKELLHTLLDYDLLPIYIFRLFADICTAPVATYLQIVLRHMGFSTFQTNALTIPYNVIAIITMIGLSVLSERLKSLAFALALIPIWILATLIPLRFWGDAQKNIWGTWGLLTVLLGHAPSWPLTISWCSYNSNGVRTRAVSAAVVNMFSQAAAIIGSNIYRKDDAPLYKRGNQVLIGITFATLAVAILSRFYYQFRNKQKEAQWSALTPEEQENYVHASTVQGNKRLDFRFRY
ncbi:MFS general substrate transporter [Suhomyces tanzawaensis NRRL Y-17324]|uniref:MFS general substrate transporter n=1 Tax=Suhomyces tanzawaensis NRRL Y-17324 TaxID=984487 RepID=A0A1E4SRM5_9ASCO|nr:MFS general substrate transporter [Suhomyces tanzawaensis NRRL Y-17324]ODV82160.1 MFS general substrate transporter [Suhomyces tanzawaensis NRRL Y-17324]